MRTKFRVTDSKGKKYTIEQLQPMTYSLKDSNGHYAEIKYDGENWSEQCNNSFIPKFEYDVAEIGNIIQEHFDF